MNNVLSRRADCVQDPDSELTDIFYTSRRKGHVFRVKLNAWGIVLQPETDSGTKEQAVQMDDIVGMRLQKCHNTPPVDRPKVLGTACGCGGRSGTSVKCEDNSAYLYVYAYVLRKNLRSTLRRERTMLTLRFKSFDTFELNMREAERWHKALTWHKERSLDGASRPPGGEARRRLLILLNPKSGSGKARALFHRYVAAVLSEAELPYDLHVTKHSGYAHEFVRQRSLASWCGIVAVGGDGLFFEVLNGVLQRPDCLEVLQNVAFGIVPCGSGNGLAKSISHYYREPFEPKPVLGAALTIISRRTTRMDLVRIELENQILYSFLSVGWGLISDIDIESERLRALGYQRFTLWTLHRLISLRTYRGRVSYLVKGDADASAYLGGGQYPSAMRHSRSCNTYANKVERNYFQSTECLGGGGGSEFDDVISLEISGNHSFRSRCDSWFSAGSRKSTYYSISDSIYHSVAGESDCTPMASADADAERMPAVEHTLHQPIPDTWVVEEGEFVMVHAIYQTHLSSDCFFAPGAKLNDGTIYLVIIRNGISRSQLLNFMMNMSSGTHLPTKANDFVKVAAVTAFRIEPYDKRGILTVDGERVEFGSLQGEVLAGLAKIMVPK